MALIDEDKVEMLSYLPGIQRLNTRYGTQRVVVNAFIAKDKVAEPERLLGLLSKLNARYRKQAFLIALEYVLDYPLGYFCLTGPGWRLHEHVLIHTHLFSDTVNGSLLVFS